MAPNGTTLTLSHDFNLTHLEQGTTLGVTPRSLDELNYLFDSLASNLDNFYTLTYGIMILLMTMGFAFVEAGCVRSKNTHNILLKNFLDAFVAGISYWTIGYGLAYGEGNSFVGWTNFASSYMENGQMANYFYQVMFASTACTIVSGSLAERCNFHAYLIYSFFLTALVYPFCTRWGWSPYGYLHVGHMFEIEDGRTAHIKYEDFGGSGVVHLTGGTAGLVGAIILGPRIGRFHQKTEAVLPIRGHSLPLAVMGIFVLFFGFMAFNAASQGHISQPGDGGAISMAVFNTVICASMGGMTALFTNKFGLFGNHWSMPQVINGCFAAMVASCGPCNSMKPWGAVIVGFVAAMVMNYVEILMFKLKIDDPLNAVGVHFGGGMWGAISVAFVKYPTGILMAWDRQAGARLAWQLSGVLTYMAWTAACMTIVFGALRLLGLFRVPRDVEINGLDISKHGQPAYPIEAYGHGYMEKILGLSNSGELTEIEQGFESDVFVRDQGPYEHQEAKVMGVHRVKTVSSVLELNAASVPRAASKRDLPPGDVASSSSHSNLSASSQVAIIGARRNWTLGPAESHAHINNGLELAGENGLGTAIFERTTL